MSKDDARRFQSVRRQLLGNELRAFARSIEHQTLRLLFECNEKEFRFVPTPKTTPLRRISILVPCLTNTIHPTA